MFGGLINIFLNTVQAQVLYTRAHTCLYERTHAHPTPMSIPERLSRLIILRFYEVTVGAS